MALIDRLRTWEDANPLRVWRRKHDYSLRQAAQIVGTNFNSIRDWEMGITLPRDESFDKLRTATDDTGIEQAWLDWWEARPS